MNVYDFDNTIYDGESLFDFFLFCLKKEIHLIRFVPQAIWILTLYKLNKLDLNKLRIQLEKIVSCSLGNHEDYVKEFWVKNISKIKPEFLAMLKEDDLIITGCPNILFDHIKDKIKVKNIICSEFDVKSRKIKFLCLGKNKVDMMNKKFPNIKINQFYTDSKMDQPLMDLSFEVFLVKKKHIYKIK